MYLVRQAERGRLGRLLRRASGVRRDALRRTSSALPRRRSAPSPGTAADAFDRLYEAHAAALVRQAFLLCGSHRLARRSVVHAFRLAWRRWPQVAADPDPGGWVRAAAYKHALAPWQHTGVIRGPRRTRAMRHVPPGDRALLDALLRLPLSYRGALLLHDGLGLSLGDTAAEAEAGTAAVAGRLRHARAALADRVPALCAVPEEELPRVTALLVRQLAAPQPASLPGGASVRRGGEVRAWCTTAAALGLPAVLTVALVAYSEPDVPTRPVPKPPQATLAPERPPGRLQPMVGPRGPGATPHPERTDAGPAPRSHAGGAGPFAAGV